MADFRQYGSGKSKGPYGTNVGDIWLGVGSDIQARLDADGEGLKLVHEIMDQDGKVEERIYVTKNAEILKEAQAGHERYVLARATLN